MIKILLNPSVKKFGTTASFLIAIFILLSACANPQVNINTEGYNQQKYQVDISDCRGGTLLEASATNLGNAAIGSLWGVFHGAPAGAMAGDGWEGAAIGAVIGGVIGLGAGASPDAMCEFGMEEHSTAFTAQSSPKIIGVSKKPQLAQNKNLSWQVFSQSLIVTEKSNFVKR